MRARPPDPAADPLDGFGPEPGDGLADAWGDLAAGSSCLGCGRGGRLLCPACHDGLPGTPVPARPTPCPPGLLATWAAAPYDGLVRDLVLGHKERGLMALARPLGGLLALAVLAATHAGGARRPVLLVPVPSSRAATRHRGHDPTERMVREATAVLREVGVLATRARLLALRGAVRDQAGLSAEQRAANLAGSLWCPSAGVRRLSRRSPRGAVVVCDDVLTTGATLREAQRALTAVGLAPVAAATVAATRRRDIRTHLGGPALATGGAQD